MGKREASSWQEGQGRCSLQGGGELSGVQQRPKPRREGGQARGQDCARPAGCQPLLCVSWSLKSQSLLWTCLGSGTGGGTTCIHWGLRLVPWIHQRAEKREDGVQLHVGLGGHKELQGPRTTRSNSRLRVLAGSAPPQSRRPGSWESRGMRPSAPCAEQRPAHTKGSSGVQAPHSTVHSTLDQVSYEHKRGT